MPNEITMTEDRIEELSKKLFRHLFPLDHLPQELSEIVDKYGAFRKELRKESDRGCALLATSQLELNLEKLLSKKMVGSNKHKKKLFEFNGPLGTFSSRILITYSIGLISKFHMDDLQAVRKIRNEFGHTPKPINFDNETIGNLCKSLKFKRPGNKTHRDMFISSVSFIYGGLIGLAIKETAYSMKEEIDVEMIQKTSMAFEEYAQDALELISKSKTRQ
jgi:hypothetical protein